MQPLSAEKILAVWEAGRQQHELDRALTLLAAGTPGIESRRAGRPNASENATRICCGCAHSCLVRPQLDSPSARNAGSASSCRSIPPRSWRDWLPTVQLDVPTLHEVEANGIRLGFRLPTSRDLAEVVAAPNTPDASPPARGTVRHLAQFA